MQFQNLEGANRNQGARCGKGGIPCNNKLSGKPVAQQKCQICYVTTRPSIGPASLNMVERNLTLRVA